MSFSDDSRGGVIAIRVLKWDIRDKSKIDLGYQFKMKGKKRHKRGSPRAPFAIVLVLLLVVTAPRGTAARY